ncbi:MAG: transcription elongation factor GreB [Pseudomonadota bacterium]|nr:transcription elongation factor GreB [Pseudomonadota bacterium]
MSKAFTKENDDAPEDDEGEGIASLPAGSKNYMTPTGHTHMRAEFDQLWKTERPQLVETIAWAASNGDRSENGDYIYGKRRLREIDRRLRYLGKGLENAEVVDPAFREETDQIFFGATVKIVDDQNEESTYTIVGIDEADLSKNHISWISPMAHALLKAREGDTVMLMTPAGRRELQILEVRYEPV